MQSTDAVRELRVNYIPKVARDIRTLSEKETAVLYISLQFI